MHLIYIFLICSFFSSFSQCGKVIKVNDGDTFLIKLLNEKILKIRLAFIDAPEFGQEFGQEAKLYTTEMLLGKTVCVDVKYKDRFGRSVALVKYRDVLFNEEMLKAGMAWHYTQFSHNTHLRTLELEARKKSIGLWKSKKVISPWDWRKKHISTNKRKIK